MDDISQSNDSCTLCKESKKQRELKLLALDGDLRFATGQSIGRVTPYEEIGALLLDASLTRVARRCAQLGHARVRPRRANG